MLELRSNIEQLTGQAGGMWGVTVTDLHSGEKMTLNGSEPFNSASIIKVPIMAAAFAAVYDGELALGSRIECRLDDMAGGSGIMRHLTPGVALTVNDLITLMIIQSDNTATNMLIDALGTNRIQATVAELGMTNTRFYHKVGLMMAQPEGRNTITADDAAIMLTRLGEGSFISRHACQQMIDIMKNQQYRNGLPQQLPAAGAGPVGILPEWELANKTGWVDGIQHDAGILYAKGRAVAVTVLSRNGGTPSEALACIAAIGREVYRYMCRQE
ncbi:serine hydrolase [Paenibacillus beijingensis]|uniref:Beta-lactamase class A catalytic domain-containing protein n=1 Tax=Paenibacillus beijingensis TaxID=1126833 RepID=A0A0D5NJ11_9BACL|nr:serine hydrolase [Paenibacillus beijingensis]AJY75100.1 hypothetical protein VN24_11580 [Paenibacillus beijingensis]